MRERRIFLIRHNRTEQTRKSTNWLMPAAAGQPTLLQPRPAALPSSSRQMLAPPLANYALSRAGQWRVHAPGRSAAGRSSTDAGGAEPATGHLGFKHCRPTAGTSIPQLRCSGSILSRFRLRPIAVTAVNTYAPAVVFKETNRSVSPETERQLVGRKFAKVRAKSLVDQPTTINARVSNPGFIQCCRIIPVCLVVGFERINHRYRLGHQLLNSFERWAAVREDSRPTQYSKHGGGKGSHQK